MKERLLVYDNPDLQNAVITLRLEVFCIICSAFRRRVMILDKFDQKILSLLKDNARQSASSIAEQVNLSRTSVSDRIRRMEERGDILGYQAITAERSEESESLKAFVEIKNGGYQCANIPHLLLKYSEVKHCYGASGEVDLLVYLEFSEMEKLHKILNHVIEELPEGAKVVTHMIIQEWVR